MKALQLWLVCFSLFLYNCVSGIVLLVQKVGEIAKITCTPDYGYGASGFPAWGIMPNSTLMFEIEVLSV